jgi:ABC-2 type transport system permease protein
VHTLRAARLILTNDLRRRLRNRSFLVMAFIGPLVLAVVVSLAFGTGVGLDVMIGVVADDRSELSLEVQDGLVELSGDGIAFEELPVGTDPATWIDDADEDAAIIVLPEGFAASLASDRPGTIQVRTDAENQAAGAVALSVAQQLAARIDAGRLAIAAAGAQGLPPPGPTALLDAQPVIQIERRTAEGQSTVSSVGPGMGLLFLFLSVSLVARSLLEEKRLQVLDRMRSSPVSTLAILLSKCAGVVVVSCASMLTLWGATTILLGAAWGSPPGVLLLIAASSVAVAGIGGVIAGLATSEQAADMQGTAVAFVFGIVGGSLVPLSLLPDALVRMSYFTPNGWALHGFAEISAGEGTIVDVLPNALVLLAWGLVAGTIAAILLPRRLAAR